MINHYGAYDGVAGWFAKKEWPLSEPFCDIHFYRVIPVLNVARWWLSFTIIAFTTTEELYESDRLLTYCHGPAQTFP